MQKSILMIGNTSWGMYRFRGDLVQYLVTHGFRVVIVAPSDVYSRKLKEIGAEYIELAVDRKGTNPFKDLNYIIKLVKILFSVKPDVVISYTIKPVLYGTLAAWLSGVPQRIAVTTGLGNTFNSANLINKITKVLYKFCLRFSSQVWFLNSDDRDTFLINRLVFKDKVFLLPGEGVDVDHYCPGPENNSMTFTLISRMLWDKGVGLFVEAARILKKKRPDIIFRVVGPVDTDNPEGISKEQMESWNLEGVIQYLGPTDDIRGILLQTTCLVHPTYYKEGLPRVLMEASAMGVPCITTDIPGCKDVVVDGFNGYLIPTRNVLKLVDAMERFIQLEPDQRKEFSANGMRRVRENFSSEKINSIYMSRMY